MNGWIGWVDRLVWWIGGWLDEWISWLARFVYGVMAVQSGLKVAKTATSDKSGRPLIAYSAQKFYIGSSFGVCIRYSRTVTSASVYLIHYS